MTQNEQTVRDATAEEPAAGRLEWIDPLLDFTRDDETSRIIVDPFNHRKQRPEVEDTTEPDPGLIASVDAVGVQQAPVLRPQEGKHEGRLGIVIGQRRMKAARAAAERAEAEGRPYRRVLVIIRDDLKGVDDEALAGSMVENIHRKAASTQDDLDAAQQIALMVGGKRVPKARKARLAAAIGRTEAELDVAHKVAAIDPGVIEELTEDEVDFDWVEMADYDEVKDVSGALWKLDRAKRQDGEEGNAKRGAWQQVMQTLRAEKAKAERIAAATAELAEKKVPVIKWPQKWENTTARPLEELVSAIGRPLTEQGHGEACKGHAAAIDPADGQVVWLCTDFKARGHRIAGAPGPGDPDGATDAATKAAVERAMTEREQRRRVRVNNAAWRSVREVRQQFVTEMCQGKDEAPADVKTLVMTAILEGRYNYTHYVGGESGTALAVFLKNAKLKSRPADVIAALVKRTAAKRLWWLLVAHIAGMYEFEFMGDDAWRGPDTGYGRRSIRPETVTWLNFLRAHGYSLSEVEEETLTTAQRCEREREEALAGREAERKEREERRKREEAKAELEEERAEDGEPDDGAEPGPGGGDGQDDEGADGPGGQEEEPGAEDEE